MATTVFNFGGGSKGKLVLMLSAVGCTKAYEHQGMTIPFADNKYVDGNGYVLRPFKAAFVISANASQDRDAHTVTVILSKNGNAIYTNTFWDNWYAWRTYTGTHDFAAGDRISLTTYREYTYSMGCCVIYKI